jgi:carboxymethylenebutenolidase
MGNTVYAIHASYNKNDVDADAYLSRPLDSNRYPAIILLHEWWGLDRYHRELTRQLARDGYVVITPHLYGRETEPTDDRHEAARRKTSLDIDRAIREIDGSVSFASQLPHTQDSIAIMGFCMGGGLALLALGEVDTFDAGVVYYPSIYPETEMLAQISSPLQFHSGSEDYPTHRSELKRIKNGLEDIRQDLNKFDTPYEYYEYDGAEHAFMNPDHSYYDEQTAELAWDRSLEFLSKNLSE